jgi:DNA-binding transcriptional MerR regulator
VAVETGSEQAAGSAGRAAMESLTIDELARQVGMTVRNVRAHQSRGLLPPPEIRGRTGFYGPDHVARLELVKDLQAEGFNLESIRRILERSPDGSAANVLDFTRAVAAPFTEEEPEVVESDELLGRYGDELTPALMRRIQKLGFIQPLGDGRLEVSSPRLMRASEELERLGVPLETRIDVVASLKRHSESIARAYVRLFLEHVWLPFVEAGEPEERWPEIRETLERLRPLATESLVAAFQVVMTRQVERAQARELERMSGPEGRRGRRR